MPITNFDDFPSKTEEPKKSMYILLETERLLLRRFTVDDLEHLFNLDNDPEVMRYINGGTPAPREWIEKTILPVFVHYDDCRPGFGFWAAIEKNTGDFLGWFSFRASGENPREAILGYRLHHAAWGKGYATEGARALIEKGFNEMAVERIVATTYQDNLASRRVMEKIGMRFVRAFRYTPEDIKKSDTSMTDSVAVWDGDDVEYALSNSQTGRTAFLKRPF